MSNTLSDSYILPSYSNKDVEESAAILKSTSSSVSWANKLDSLTRVSSSDPEGFLAHPVNAYKLMKRLHTEWSQLESLVLQDPSEGTHHCVCVCVCVCV